MSYFKDKIVNAYPIVFRYQRLSLNLHEHLYCSTEQIALSFNYLINKHAEFILYLKGQTRGRWGKGLSFCSSTSTVLSMTLTCEYPTSRCLQEAQMAPTATPWRNRFLSSTSWPVEGIHWRFSHEQGFRRNDS